MNRLFRVLFLFGVFWSILFASDAHAYIDPGSGSFFIQVALAALFSALVALKMFWRNVKEFLKRKFGRSSQQNDHDQ